jgi:hypothetical protein
MLGFRIAPSWRTVLACALVALLVAMTGVGTADATESSDKNHPEYWEDLGYGNCTKYESPGTPYILPAGTWTLLVVKAGSESSTNDPHAEYHNPTPGPYYHPSGKTISHVIRCGSGGGTTTTTSTPGSTTTNPCGNYTPRQLTLSQASVEPGDEVTISGVAGGLDTLVITISGSGVATTNLGSVVTAANGSFSKVVRIPDAFPAGTYTIKLTSTKCGKSGTISVVTQSVNRSGCGTGNPLVIVRGVATTWKLIAGTPAFNQAKPVQLTITRRTTGGVSYTLYSGAWPAGSTRSITVPASAPADRYFLVQSGSQQGNNKARTESCPVRVAESASSISSVRPAGPGLADGARGALALVFGAFVLLSLRQSRRTARKQTA